MCAPQELAALPLDQRALAQENKAKLVELLKDIQQGKDDGSRYNLALRGKIVPSGPVVEQRVRYVGSQPAAKVDE